MIRFEEQSEAIWQGFPSEYVDIAVLVTDLGDVTALIFVLSVLYWVSDRRKAALVASYAVVGVSVVVLLKSAFAMPRPEVEIIAREYDPYGFPSGHAFISVVVYGGIVYVFDRYRDPIIVGAVAALVAAISLSRVVLGVHYLGDILAGAVAGLVFLGAMSWITDGEPGRGFVLGILLAIPVIVTTTGEARMLAVVGLGAAVGGLVATLRFDAVPSPGSGVERAVLVATGTGFLVGVGAIESAVAGENLALVSAFHAILVGGVFLLPVVVDRVDSGFLRKSRSGR